MSDNASRSREAGFTMIEVMIAMLVTAIALIGIIAMFMSQTTATGYSRHTTEATVLAEDKVEKLRTQGSGGSLGAGGSDSGIDEKGVSGGIYNRSWNVAVGSGGAFYDLAVTVQWSENGVSKSVIVRSRRSP